jgi:hypothetical protein
VVEVFVAFSSTVPQFIHSSEKQLWKCGNMQFITRSFLIFGKCIAVVFCPKPSNKNPSLHSCRALVTWLVAKPEGKRVMVLSARRDLIGLQRASM